MTEQYKTYVFFHTANANQATVQSAYDTAMQDIENDGGNPIAITSYISQGQSKVSIVYKSSKAN